MWLTLWCPAAGSSVQRAVSGACRGRSIVQHNAALALLTLYVFDVYLANLRHGGESAFLFQRTLFQFPRVV
jgi:hypothetical protein